MVKKKIKRRVKRTIKRPKSKKTGAKKRATSKRRILRKPKAKKGRVALRRAAEPALEKIGEVTHYFPKVRAAAILILKDSLKLGDEVYVKGHTTDFKEKIISMQVDHMPIKEGKKGEEIGLLVNSRVRAGDNVYKV